MKKTYKGLRQQILLLSLCTGPIMALPCQAAPTIPGFIGNINDVLPEIPVFEIPSGGVGVLGIESIQDVASGQMEIKQNAPKAVIRWQTFNIGDQASVNFDQQKNAGWKVLNSIDDVHPSQIKGNLTADGSVYLINRNGILFGGNAQVDVHSLTASSLNLKEEDFLNGYSGLGNKVTTFHNQDGSPGGLVKNEGHIRVKTGGSVMLFGGRVENSGTIEAARGQVALAAGSEVTVNNSEQLGRKLNPEISTSGDEAVVSNNGQIQADEGMAGLYGGIVNQAGRIRSITAVERNGQIELVAKNKVTTASGSVISTPVTESKEKKGVAEFKTGQITVQAKEFIHNGSIISPGGEVAVNVKNRIILEKGSSIDVSGVMVDEQASDRIIEVQLETDVLKDAQVQKQGALLGKKVKIDILSGMPIADLSGYLSENRIQSAEERLSKGGNISLNVSESSGSIEVKSGASLSFAGGGIKYAAGAVDVTRVRSGNRIYSLAELPEYAPVDEVLGYFEKVHSRFGVKEVWNGVYYGGASPMMGSQPSVFVGSDAGNLTFITPYLSLQGILDGQMKAGFTQTDDQEKVDSQGRINALGHKRPQAGTLNVGVRPDTFEATTAISVDSITHAIAVYGSEEAASFVSQGPMRTSVIDAEALTAARLSHVGLFSNTTLAIDKSATVELIPGGSFMATARQVEHAGTIMAPGGVVELAVNSNITSYELLGGKPNDRHVALGEKITIAKGSLIDVSGEIVDNSGFAIDEIKQGIIKGGSIDISNQSLFTFETEADANPNHSGRVTFSEGAVLGARGGYRLSPTGKLKGGDAGSVSIATSGVTDAIVTLDGEMEGHAILGNKGGNLTVRAFSVAVVPDDVPIPSGPVPGNALSDQPNRLIIVDNRFSKTGFSNIKLQALNDLTVTRGAKLAPSNVRLAVPEGPSLASKGGAFVEATPLDAGSTQISLGAGALLTIEQGAVVEVMPSGVIELKDIEGGNVTDNATIHIGGSLIAPSGTIKAEGKFISDILIEESGSLLARGTVIAVPVPAGYGDRINQKVLDGGSIILSALDVRVDPGALLDVSGSEKITNTYLNDAFGLFHREEAGRPGSLGVTYTDGFHLDGQVLASAQMEGLPGGRVSLTRNGNTMFVPESDTLQDLKAAGFDELTLKSMVGIGFEGDTSIDVVRGLTLDAPQLKAGSGKVLLSAPWVRLVNSSNDIYKVSQKEELGGELTVDAGFIDVVGNVQVNGVQSTALRAKQDLRLSDQFYTIPAKWSGKFATQGDLFLQAEAIYPTTNSIFTIKSDGDLAIFPQDQASRHPIYSAAGKLTVEAASIDHHGVLAAPMGELSLKSKGRVQLAPESLLSVRGEGEVALGLLQFGAWKALDKNSNTMSNNIAVQQIDPKLTISAKEIVAMDGSVIDAGAGGSVSGREFQPGLAGSVNPLARERRLIIMADNSVTLPGEAIYIEGDPSLGIEAGVYSVLPESYGFLPNAMVLEAYRGEILPGEGGVNRLGQPVMAGYETRLGTNIKPATMQGYVVRTAADVLREGKFDVKSIDVVNGGAVAITAPTVVMGGEILAPGKESGLGGSLTMAANSIRYGTLPPASIPVSAFEKLPDVLTGGLFINNETLKDSGLLNLTLGNDQTTDIILTQDSLLTGIAQISLVASDNIFLDGGAAIHAIGGKDSEGILQIHASTLTTEETSLLHASNEITFALDQGMDFRGDWRVDSTQGRLNFQSERIFMGESTGNITDSGLILDNATVNKFSGISELGIKSNSDISFLNSFDLDLSGRLTLDAARIMVDSRAVAGRQINIGADSLTLKNSGAMTKEASASPADHTMMLAADQIVFGPGTVTFDTFKGVNVTSRGEIQFQGETGVTARLGETGSLGLTADRFVAAFPTAKDQTFSASSLTVDAKDGEVKISGRKNLQDLIPSHVPGKFAVSAGEIVLNDARIDLPGGVIDLTAKAIGGNVAILGESVLNTAGGVFSLPSLSQKRSSTFIDLSGGRVSLHSDFGGVSIAQESTIDVSDEQGKDAGVLEVIAAKGDVVLNGTLNGGGGSFLLDTLSIDDFSVINSKVFGGGFTEQVAIRARTGDMLVDSNQVVEARQISLAADQGAVTLKGQLLADGELEGGRVAIHSGTELLLDSTGVIKARGLSAGATGGEVVLSSASGQVVTAQGDNHASLIDVSGGDNGEGGVVTFRSLRTEKTENNITTYGMQLDHQGQVVGSRRTVAQAVKVYEDSSITSTDMSIWKSDADTFMAKVEKPLDMVIVPEIEVRSAGDMTLSSGLNTLDVWRSGGVPGVLTFRSGSHLKVETDVIDAPTQRVGLYRLIEPDGKVDSFGLNFIAGADLQASDFMATDNHTGNLSFGKVGKTHTIFTESAPIRFASGGETTVNAPGATSRNYMPGVASYTLATFDGDIEGLTGGDLDLSLGGVIQSATGDIKLQSGGNLILNENGAIRTTGRAPEWNEVPQEFKDWAYESPSRITGANTFRVQRYWDYRDGGSVYVTTKGVVDGAINTVDRGSSKADTGWDGVYKEPLVSTNHWGADYTGSKQGNGGVIGTTGVSAMSSGSVTINAEGSVRGQAATFGIGNLAISSGGDLDGRFMAANGDLMLRAAGSFGMKDKDVPVELGGGDLLLQSMGSISLGVIDNPQYFNRFLGNVGLYYQLGYGVDSTATVTSVNGDVILSGNIPYHEGIGGQEDRGKVLPTSLFIHASQDIAFQNTNWIMAPSPQGGLKLIAGRDIIGSASSTNTLSQGEFFMSDADPSRFFGVQMVNSPTAGGLYGAKMKTDHQQTALHRDDADAVAILAGHDIKNISFMLPKKGSVRAEHDISNFHYLGQNINADDVTLISAGHDISLLQPPGYTGGHRSIQVGGPSYLLVQAGNNLDLGVSEVVDYYGAKIYGGIVTYGSAFNPALQSEISELGRPKGADVGVIVGYDIQPGIDELEQFVNTLRPELQQFSKILNEGDVSAAAAFKEEIRTKILMKFLGGHQSGDGQLNMTSSTINTKSGEDSITIIAAGDLNVGLSSINRPLTAGGQEPPDSGIFTTSGGAINLLIQGDINVNESRVMGFLGSPILLFSDQGDVNAGRGSSTTLIVAPPRVETTWNNNNTPNDPSDDYEQKKPVFNPPAVGSGVRGLSYDPDGTGPLLAPPEGDVILVAWDGVIDAGEAGIHGGNVYLGATKVLNAQNVGYSGVSVGVPATAGAPAGLAALSGNSMEATESTAGGIIKEAAAASSAAAEKIAGTAKSIADALSQLRVFVVKFMGFMQ